MKFTNFFFAFALMLFSFSCQKEKLEVRESESAVEDSDLQARGPNNWLAFQKGASSDYIFFSRSSDGNSFTQVGSLGLGEQTDRTPSAVKYGSDVFVYYRGKSTHDLWVARSTTQGSTWASQYHFSPSNGAINMGSGPSAIRFAGEIFVFYTGGGGVYYYRTGNATTYDGPTRLIRDDPFNIADGPLGGVSVLEVAPVYHQNRLYLFYVTTSPVSNGIGVVNSDNGNEGTWRPVSEYIGERTSTGISAVSTGSEIILTFTGLSSKKVYEKRITTSGVNGQVLTMGPTTHIGSYTTDRPGIDINGSKVVVLHKDGTGPGNGYVKGKKLTLPGNSWSALNWGAAGSGWAGSTSHGVSVLHTGF